MRTSQGLTPRYRDSAATVTSCSQEWKQDSTPVTVTSLSLAFCAFLHTDVTIRKRNRSLSNRFTDFSFRRLFLLSSASMRHVRPVSLRFLSSRLQPERRRLHCSRPCRPSRIFSIHSPLPAFSLPRRKQVLALGYSPDVEFNPIEETEFSPAYTESLSYALVSAFPALL